VKIGPFISILFLVLIFIGLGSKGHIFEKGIFIQYPYLFSLPILAMLLGIIAGIMGLKRKYFTTFILMALTILIFIISGYLSLMPNFMISTLDPSNSLSIVDVAADQSTLIVMFISTLIFLPIVLGYQIYKYIRFWGE
jgi:cytochrome d ubiquinol oxidase subunit II